LTEKQLADEMHNLTILGIRGHRDMAPCHKVVRESNAQGPRDALNQSKSCQLLHNCTKITFD